MSQNNDELYHYGVLGMKWGKRKSNYITYRQASKNAKAAGDKAAKESLARDRKDLSGIGSGRKALKNANKARNNAIKELIAKDKDYNKALKKNRTKKATKPQNSLDKYTEATKKNTALRRAGYGSKIASGVMTNIGKNLYSQYKDGASPGMVKAIKLLGNGGKVMNAVGNIQITSSMIRQYRDWDEFKRS